jgi:hypothetical protein
MSLRLVRICSLFVLAALLVAGTARAQSPTPAPSPRPRPCTSPEHRQFDFWIGVWEVKTANGNVAGINTIEPIHGGCALKESWAATGGFSGTSLNTWNSAAKGWHQTWVDSSGTLLQLDGGLKDGKMVLTGETAGRDGPVHNEITWERLDGGRIRQIWRATSDGGKTWQTAFDGIYEKKKG